MMMTTTNNSSPQSLLLLVAAVVTTTTINSDAFCFCCRSLLLLPSSNSRSRSRNTNRPLKRELSSVRSWGSRSSISDDDDDFLICLGSPHHQQPQPTPADILHELAEYCHQNHIDALDVYGDYDQTSETSFLRQFEKEMVHAFTDGGSSSSSSSTGNVEDAVFMPSGVMAQSIALLIHRDDRTMHNTDEEDDEEGNDSNRKKKAGFACHETSHLLLHEQDGYRELLDMGAVVISTKGQNRGISIPPMKFADVEKVLSSDGDRCEEVSTLIIEIPHRELGGKLTPWDDLERISKYCKDHGIAFHCDGARLFEAAAGYETKTLADFAALFDSIYISFYKGLGGISGAMLLGSKDFCEKARVWLRRFGGNLYTLMPYAVSGWAGYRRQWCLELSPLLLNDEDNEERILLSFEGKTNRLKSIVQSLSADKTIDSVVTFDPPIPETCMVHGYLRHSIGVCQQALDAVQERCGIQVLRRVRPVSKESVAYREGYRSMFELVLGENNANYSQDTFLKGWNHFAAELLRSRESS